MAFTIILLCSGIQRWLGFDSASRRVPWFSYYYAWLNQYAESWQKAGAWVMVLGLLVPPFFVFGVLFALIYHFLGAVVYYLLNLVVFWYCFDVRRLNRAWLGDMTARQTFALVYQRVFAMIFWYLILGPVGPVLYSMVTNLRELLERESQLSEYQHTMLRYTIFIEGVLDWIPLRLLGLTYALVGHFSPTFTLWYRQLLTGISHTREQAASCGLVALDLPEEKQQPISDAEISSVEILINRALILWLAIIALISIASWFAQI